MGSIDFSADGNSLFMAVESLPAGTQKVLKYTPPTATTYVEAYSVTGTSCNVIKDVADPDTMYFYGNFGTNVLLIKHTISTGANVDISPPGLGAFVINAMAVNPSPLTSGMRELIVGITGDRDIMYSSDGGASWVAWDNNTITVQNNALDAVWGNVYFPHGYVTGGRAALVSAVALSPNEGESETNITGTVTGTNVSSVQWVGE